jgi:hypothetical protein
MGDERFASPRGRERHRILNAFDRIEGFSRSVARVSHHGVEQPAQARNASRSPRFRLASDRNLLCETTTP